MTRAQLVRRNRAQRAEASRRLSIVPAPRPTLGRRLACLLGFHRVTVDRWAPELSRWIFGCRFCSYTEERGE